MAHATVNFIADSLRRPITIDVIFPTDKMVSPTKYIPEKAPMKTLYFLEGSSGNYHRPLTHTLLECYAEDNNLCVVIVGGEDKWYGNSKTSGDYYADLITTDLINFTRATFNLSDKREDTYISGFSMGGFGALTCGLRHPEIFGRVMAHAPALCKSLMLASTDEPGNDAWTKSNYETMFGFSNIQEELEGSTYDYEALARKIVEDELEKPEIFLSCGELDGLFPYVKLFAEELESLGFNTVFCPTKGNHNWCVALNEGFQKQIEWLPTDDFKNNFKQTEENSNYEWPDFFIWRTHYNTEHGKCDLPQKQQGAKNLTGYRL